MKRTRKLLYTIVMAIVVAAVALFACACGDKDAASTKYTVTFMNASAVYNTAEYDEGATVVKPEDPSRSDYVFDGWSLSEGGAIVDVVTSMPAQNLVYYAVFSKRYTLTLDAGIYGTLAEEDTTLTVKAGENLYTLVADIVPTVGNSSLEFAAWFQGNNELKKGSKYIMPSNDLTVTAKYSVGYTVSIYKQTDLNGGYELAENKNAKGYVGEMISEVPTYDGYRYNSEKVDGPVITATPLTDNVENNNFKVYYNLRDYSVMYYSNLPVDVQVDGEMSMQTCAHGIEYLVPECEFSADGYRFQGWATSASGAVEYRPVRENKFSVTKVTNFYAVWVKALTDASNESNDRIYIMDNADGDKVVYLERYALQDDIEGAFDVNTGIFTFTDASGDVVLRGIASEVNGRYTYLDNDKSVYKLMNADGTLAADKTLTVNADGVHAVYNDGTTSFSGSFEYVPEQYSLKFTSENKEFFFRINSAKGSNVNGGEAVFEIRGDEYGIWENLLQTGVVDTSYGLMLDGYGEAIMLVYGFNNSMNDYTTTPFSAYYSFTNNTAVSNIGKEIQLYVYNSGVIRPSTCLLIVASEGNEFYGPADADGNKTAYTHVYIDSFAQTIYAQPDDGDAIDKSGNKIELSSYSVDYNSATYTYKDSSGNIQTVKGRYSYDRYSGILTITPASGDPMLFEIDVVSEGEGENYNVYKELEEICGQYYILGLESVFAPYGFYRIRIQNDGKASFAFLLPIYTDTFYGQIGMEYYPMFSGEYKEVTAESTDSNGKAIPAVYEFVADESLTNAVIQNIYVSYYYMFGIRTGLDVTSFKNFKFSFITEVADEGKETESSFTYVGVTAIGDGQIDKTLKYNDGEKEVTYTLDGFGYVKEDENARYIYDTAIGVNRIALILNYSEQNQKVITFIDADNDGEDYKQYSVEYNSGNTDTTLKLIVFDNNDAMLSILYSNSFHVVSQGKVIWEKDASGNNIGGSYKETTGSYSSVQYVGLTKEYHDFDFYLNGTQFFVDEASETITVEGVGTLRINHDDNVATFIDADGTSYSGACSIRGDIVKIPYATANDAGVKTLKLSENRDSFKEVIEIAGYWMDMSDNGSYIYVSGDTDGEKFIATYYEYNENGENETADWTAKSGTFVNTSKTDTDGETIDGYDFTFDGETEIAFTFNIGKNSLTGIPVFGRYIGEELNRYIYARSVAGNAVAVGILTGGGYNSYIFAYGSTSNRMSGEYSYDDEKGYYFFVDNSATGTYYYFVKETDTEQDEDGNDRQVERWFLRDGMYAAPNYGVYEFNKNGAQQVELDPDSETDKQLVTVKSFILSGTYIATLNYVDGNSENGSIVGKYIAYQSGLYLFAVPVERDGNTVYNGLFWFKLYTSGDENDPMLYVRIMNGDTVGAYVGNDNSVVYFDGYETAIYVDSRGRIYSATFVKVEGTENIIRVSYVDLSVFNPENYTFNRKVIYIQIDVESKTFTYTSDPSDHEQGD